MIEWVRVGEGEGMGEWVRVGVDVWERVRVGNAER